MDTEFFTKPVLQIVVKPGASKTEILGERNGALHIALAAPPVDGKANEELLKFLRKQTGKFWKIKTGSTSKKKLVTSIS